MSKFRYKVENKIVNSNEEFKNWLNHQGEGKWELINTRVLQEENDTRSPGKVTSYQCIFKTKN